jgi:hypothetical protein
MIDHRSSIIDHRSMVGAATMMNHRMTVLSRRPPIDWRPARPRSLPAGNARLNTMKGLVICDPIGKLLFCAEIRPGSMHDITQALTAGLVDLAGAEKPRPSWSRSS